MEIELLGVLAALLIGVVLGFLGGGGSILTVPIFVYLFHIDTILSTAYSLFVVGVASAIGAISHYTKGNVNLKVAALFAAPAAVSVYLTRLFVVPWLPETFLTINQWTLSKSEGVLLLFAGLMLYAGVNMLKKRSMKKTSNKKLTQNVYYGKIIWHGAVVGGLTGLVGAGGGFLIVPALVLMSGLPMSTAVGTSLTIIALKSLLGFIGDIQIGQPIDWRFLTLFTGIVCVGILVGTRLSGKVSARRTKSSFGWPQDP